MKYLLFFLAVAVTLLNCSEPEQKAYNKISGQWKLESFVLKGDNNVTVPSNDVTIDFESCEYGSGGCLARFDFGKNDVFTYSYAIDHDAKGDILSFNNRVDTTKQPSSDQLELMELFKKGIIRINFSDDSILGQSDLTDNIEYKNGIFKSYSIVCSR